MSSLTSIDSAGNLLLFLVSKGLDTLCADWMFNLLTSKPGSEHISHNRRHLSRWPLLSQQQLSSRQNDKEILCMCVWLSFVEKEIETEQKCLSEPVSGHISPLSLFLSLTVYLYLYLTHISDFSLWPIAAKRKQHMSCVCLCGCTCMHVAALGYVFFSYFSL